RPASTPFPYTTLFRSVGAFYLVTAASQSLGYGATAVGAKAYANGLPFSDLGGGYIGKWYADILDLMATISLLAISLGVASGAARSEEHTSELQSPCKL